MQKGESKKKRNATIQEGRVTRSARQPKQQEVLVDPYDLPFNAERLKDLIDKRFNNPNRELSKVPSMENLVYDMKENFVKADRYWIAKVRPERFPASTKARVLYRPEIVDNLMNALEASQSEDQVGIMIKGPQGIGKSFSIVNLVLHLMSTGKYLVTFIPNCEDWDNLSDFYDVICESLRIDKTQPDLQIIDKNYENLKKFLKYISDELDVIGVKWVFVFDQINRLFARPEHEKVRDIGTLPFPFNMIKKVALPGRITSIISAPANNEVAYQESQEGFDDFDHPTSFTKEELRVLYKEQLNGLDLGDFHYLTGFVPLYVSSYFKTTESDYFDEVIRVVKFSLISLETQYGDSSVGTAKWKEAVDVSVRMLVGAKLESQPNFYDRKFTYFSGKKYPKALFPLVEAAFLEIMWDNLIDYIDNNERLLLEVCKDTQITNDVRGRVFELLVIRRLQRNQEQTKTKIPGLAIPSRKHMKVQTFQGMSTLPILDEDQSLFRMWVPCVGNFAAVDVILELASQVWAIQIHVSRHSDVSARFVKMCEDAGWFQSHNDSVHLLYLSPTTAIKKESEDRLNKNQDERLKVWFASLQDLDCLKSIKWVRCPLKNDV